MINLGQGPLLTLKGLVIPTHFSKIFYSENRLANQSEILCGAFLGSGDENLISKSDQDGRHAHIRGLGFKFVDFLSKRSDVCHTETQKL